MLNRCDHRFDFALGELVDLEIGQRIIGFAVIRIARQCTVIGFYRSGIVTAGFFGVAHRSQRDEILRQLIENFIKQRQRLVKITALHGLDCCKGDELGIVWAAGEKRLRLTSGLGETLTFAQSLNVIDMNLYVARRQLMGAREQCVGVIERA